MKTSIQQYLNQQTDPKVLKAFIEFSLTGRSHEETPFTQSIHTDVKEAVEEALQYAFPDDKNTGQSKAIFMYAEQTIEYWYKHYPQRQVQQALCQNLPELHNRLFAKQITQTETLIAQLSEMLEIHDKISDQGEESDELAEIEYYNMENIKNFIYIIQARITNIEAFISEYGEK